jgi:hypothetical protein
MATAYRRGRRRTGAVRSIFMRRDVEPAAETERNRERYLFLDRFFAGK